MTPQEIADISISKHNKQLINEIFLIIQNDRELMYEYLRCVEKDGLDQTNKIIGREIKKAYQIQNVDGEENFSSTLIQSHQKFE